MDGLTLTIKLISAHLNYAAAGAGLSLAIRKTSIIHFLIPNERNGANTNELDMSINKTFPFRVYKDFKN